MTWIDAVFTYLRELLQLLAPFRIIRVYERGVVFRFGIPVRVMEPGFRWMWPLKIEDVTEVGVVEESADLMVQSITTKDNVAVTLSANIVIRVVDPIAYLCAVHSFDRSVEAYARIHLSQRARDKTWDELLADQKVLEASLKGTLSTRLAKWGAEIVSFGFTDLTKAKPFRLFSDPASAQKGLLG